jgi:Avidin family
MGLEGIWYNELNSTMELYVQGSKITGRYNTSVGDADGWYGLVGRTGGSQANKETLGFIVLWQNEKRDTDSVTVWTGELLADAEGNERIETMWLLTCETSAKDEWRSTITGKDIFTRDPPSPKSLESTRRGRAPSYPPSAALTSLSAL